MNSNTLKNLVFAALFLAVVSVFSSCNRGVGCPNNFSIDEPVELETKNTFKQ